MRAEVTLEPGERVVIRMEDLCSAEQAEQIKRGIRSAWGLAEDFPVLVLHDGQEIVR